ncbi:ABC transporter substrate-binding protein [Halalkalibacter alkaliphilus]|uniref:Extracellular solute-binding protein n=1 Tax=Halalkalibacter alkaliphilus TaxID=2917993 RepID=A0A9X2A5P8_9BACI|nr:extracellular solute-binding protein [Halalkalibacter alkaliphilus]MCL7745696.1 extracellular solute-binding protein [Halalkalibacter alkaliphilus]
MKTNNIIGCSLVIASLFLSACSTTGEEVQHETKKKLIEFFQPKPEAVEFFNEMIDQFEMLHPDIEIEQVNVPDGMAVLKTRIARGNVPDIFITYPIEQDYVVRAEKGYLLDLTNENFIQQVDPEIQNRYLINEKMYGVALSQNAVGVIYNTHIFEELQLDIPQTWDEFLLTLELLEMEGKQPILIGNKELENISVFNLNFIANEFDSDYWNKLNQGKVTITNDPRWIEASEKMLQVLDYVQDNSFSYDSEAVIHAFIEGDAAMFVDGVWMLPRIEKLDPQLTYGIFPFPVTNDVESNNVLGGVDGGFAISADTNNPDEAKLFLEFLLTKENAQKFSDYEGNISAVKGVNMNKPEVNRLAEHVTMGKTVNWPNHHWAGGTAAEAEFRRISQQFFLDRDIDTFLEKLEIMFQNYRQQQ